MIKEIATENEFKSEIKDGVVVVDFFATWCMPCKMLSPIMEKLSVEMQDKVKFIKVDVDNLHDVAVNYSISSIPTIIIFKNGEKKDMTVGFTTKGNIKNRIEPWL